MAHAKVRENNDIRLSEDAWAALDLRPGTDLEAEIVPEGVLLRRRDGTEKQRAFQAIAEITSRVQPAPEQAGKPDELIEKEILDAVHEVRLGRRQGA